MTIEELLKLSPAELVAYIIDSKDVGVPKWEEELKLMITSSEHPVYTDTNYKDIPEGATVDKVTRISHNMARQAVDTFTGLCFGIPIKRIYNIDKDENGEGDPQQIEAQKLIEKILKKNRIDSVNLKRYNQLYACCEFLTLWYGVEQTETTNIYGVESKLKIRCKTYSPINGDAIYPLFDDYGDYIAAGIHTKTKGKDESVEYFDLYTDSLHIQYKLGEGWQEVKRENITLGKNPTIYSHRTQAIYADGMDKCYEREWMLSRNGNYLRKNSAPIFGLFADEEVETGNEESQDKAFRKVFQYPAGSSANYITWEQAIENLKFQDEKLQQMFFDEIGIPNLSFSTLSSMQLSGEAYQQVFIAAIIKVMLEKGEIIETQSREVNVVKAFAKVISPDLADAIDSLDVEIEVTPFTIKSVSETIKNLTTANGGKPIMSQLEAIQQFGVSKDAEATMEQIRTEEEETAEIMSKSDIFNQAE